MRTLDKWWSKTTDKEDDVVMDDKQEKEQNEDSNENAETTQKPTQYNQQQRKAPELFPMMLRLKINSNSKVDASKKHQEILQAIAINTKHCEIYSTDGTKINLKPNNQDDFEYHKLHNKRQASHTVVHKVVLDINYHAMKKEKAILNALQQHTCHLQLHEWNSSDWDVISIGFISGSSPQHQAKDTLKHKLLTINTNAPNFNLHATTLKLESRNQQYQTLAYEIQCLRKDYQNVCEYVATTCKVLNQTFIKYQWKHSDRTTYENGIKKQISFTDSIRTIPLYGIHPIAMVLLYNELIQDNDILEINKTHKVVSHGRWNVYVTLENFETKARWFQNNIMMIYQDKCREVLHKIPPEYKPEIQFNSPIIFQVDPLLEDASKSVSSFSNTSISSQSWASVVSKPNTSSAQTISTITTINKLTTQMTHLSKTLQNLFDCLDKLEQRMNEQETYIQQIKETTTRETPHKTQQFETCQTDITIANQQDNFANLICLDEKIRCLEEKLILPEEFTRSNKRKQPQKT